MDDGDWPMGDENSVLPSTELNGDSGPDTVDPSSVVALQQNFVSTKQEQLPFHSPSKVASIQRSYQHGSDFDPPIQSPDRMDTSQSTSPRQKSPQVCIPPKPRSNMLPYATLRTGLVYDPRMRFHAELPDMMDSPNEIHPEDPRRIHAIFEEIRQAGLVAASSTSEEEPVEEHCWRIAIRPATRPEILLIHTEEHYNLVQSLQRMGEAQLHQMARDLDSIYFNNSTYECAKLAAGGAIEACKAVVQGAVRNAIAIIRPPGHHAESDSPSGFCIFNNVPIATRVCQEAYPDTCRKVLILDWDVHHGNGIQHAFYDDPNVLYVSLHVFKDGTFYPNLPDGNFTYYGEGPGEGKNVNIPWPAHGMGDAEYIYAFQEIVMPIATEFNPDLVIISAGFDAAEGDKLGGCFVTPACYGHMTHMLMSLANGKLVVCLEGGYNLRSIARSALAVTRVLMLEPPERLREDLPAPRKDAVEAINQVKRLHSKFWKCLLPKYPERDEPGYQDTFRLHEIIRQWQSQKLSLEHYMTPLPLQINKPLLSRTFEHNVVATPNFTERHPLLVIFHDPPSLRDNVDLMTGERELHNTWLTDVPKKYVDWAIENGFQVIDVNVPRITAIADSEEGFVKADDAEERAVQTRELASYLWENYIEPNEATQVFFLGIGDAYLGLVDLLGQNENCTEDDTVVELLIGFVAGSSIKSIKRSTSDTIGNWYFEHSRIFVKNSHHVWDTMRPRRVRKKLGNLVRSPHVTLDGMLEEHMKEVQDLLLEKKREYEESNDFSSRTDEQGSVGTGGNGNGGGALRSPPIPSGALTPRQDGSVGAPLRSPKMPPLGYFSVSQHSPRSPRSPLKRTF